MPGLFERCGRRSRGDPFSLRSLPQGLRSHASDGAVPAPAGRHHGLPQGHDEAAAVGEYITPITTSPTAPSRPARGTTCWCCIPGRAVWSRWRIGRRASKSTWRGRQLVGMDREREWLQVLGLEGVRCKFLIPPGAGPQAIILECPPNCVIPAPVPTFGRYDVVLSGSAVLDGKSVVSPGLRYVGGR